MRKAGHAPKSHKVRSKYALEKRLYIHAHPKSKAETSIAGIGANHSMRNRCHTDMESIKDDFVAKNTQSMLI